MSKEHEHNFIAEKYRVQEYVHQYASSGKYDTAILSHQYIMLFCTKCGETKDVSKTSKEVQPCEEANQ